MIEEPANKRVHAERIYTLSVMMQSTMPSGDAHDVRPSERRGLWDGERMLEKWMSKQTQ
jgi:hypothetical protein